MNRRTVLSIDALVSLALGLLLVTFPTRLVGFLGIPPADETLYPRLFGAAVIGIAIALFVERWGKPAGVIGLGLGGAIAIDLCAALFLAGWLVLTAQQVPLRGRIVLWFVVIVLIGVSGLGLTAQRRPSSG